MSAPGVGAYSSCVYDRIVRLGRRRCVGGECVASLINMYHWTSYAPMAWLFPIRVVRVLVAAALPMAVRILVGVGSSCVGIVRIAAGAAPA